jgi:mannosyl-3-phosphoglycerate phosphatase
MSIARVRRLTGLSRIQAARAKVREYTEPFVLREAPPLALRRLEEAARARGMTLTRGGRFWHLAGGGDKGLAVQILTSLYRRTRRPLHTLGIGDSPNDFSMLRRVDFPYLVSGPNGRYQGGYRGEGFLKAGAVGPEGWNRAVLKFLQVQ